MRLLQVGRLSRSHDASTALDKQDARCVTYASAYGHQITGTAIDSDVSGKSDPFERPGLGPWLTEPRLMASYDGIVASHLDRLARSTKYISKLLEWAEKHGKTIITVEPAIDFSTPVGKLIGYIVSWLAEQELELITKRSKDTQSFLRDNGFLVGKPPFGFTTAAHGGHRTLAADPAESEAIRAAAKRYLAGDSLRAVCGWLDSEGTEPRHGGRWSPVSLAQVFRNESLIGRRTDAAGRVILKHDPVLDRETWTRLQARMDEKASRTGIAPKDTALLTSIAVCAKCGGPMYRIYGGKEPNRTASYRCHGTDRDPSSCRNMVPLAELDSWVDARMRHDGGFVLETTVTPGTGHDDEISDVERELRELDFDRPNFLDKQAALLAERARLRALPAEPAVIGERVSGWTVGALWQVLSPAQRRAYLLASGVRVRAVKGEYSLDGDVSKLAATGDWDEVLASLGPVFPSGADA
jgi:site-specific DNA recombinase